MYIHKEDTHNLEAPQKIVPVINDMIHPKSVIDIGCGVGTFLYIFKQLGITKVKGIDGKWANRELIKKYLLPGEFENGNLSEFIDVGEKYDLAICLEVAEHIEEENADNLVKTLTNASDLILFSAAIPYQSGQYHVNEQWPSYWQKKFEESGYKFLDIARGKFWNIDMTEFWYKQNIFFVVRETSISNYAFIGDKQSQECLNIVHPDLFVKNSRLLYNIQSGKKPLSYYFKILIKAVGVKIGFLK